jgi:hypothetical protein
MQDVHKTSGSPHGNIGNSKRKNSREGQKLLKGPNPMQRIAAANCPKKEGKCGAEEQVWTEAGRRADELSARMAMRMQSG